MEQKLKAQELCFNLLARAKLVPQEELDSLLLAQEIEDEQQREARGEVIDTAHSGSNGPEGPVTVATSAPKPATGDETLQTSSSTKSSSNKGKTGGNSGNNDKKSSGKTDITPPPKKLAKGIRTLSTPGLTRIPPQRAR